MLKFLARAHAACFAPPSNGSANGGMLYLPGIFGMIGTDKGSGGLGGVAICGVVVEEAELLSIGILPERRCLDWGRALSSVVLAETRATGANTIVLAVAEGNEAAQSLYNALGFVRVGRREIYYGSGARNRIAADIMRFGLHT